MDAVFAAIDLDSVKKTGGEIWVLLSRFLDTMSTRALSMTGSVPKPMPMSVSALSIWRLKGRMMLCSEMLVESPVVSWRLRSVTLSGW